VKTDYIKEADIERKWYVIDAEGVSLGRLAVKASDYLRGKHKPLYHPSVDCGDHIVVINASKVKITGRKDVQKKYYWHTGFPGGIKDITFQKQIEKDARLVVEKAVKGMIPHNKLGREIIKKLKVYSESDHPHVSQKPQALEV
jgi:large subunit ribosomal protein L13